MEKKRLGFDPFEMVRVVDRVMKSKQKGGGPD